ncbi:MAG: anthranilate synthase component I [Bacteroidota bacterium]
MTSFEEFKVLCSGGNVVPVHEVLSADMETPVSVYRSIRRESPYSFLLESIEGGEFIARYSFLGFDPFMKCSIKGKSLSIETFHEDVRVLPSLVNSADPPLESLKTLFGHIRAVSIPGLPRLTGGAVGYFGYECAGLVEDVPPAAVDELSIPDAVLLFYDSILVFDNLKRQIVLISNAYISDPSMNDALLRREYDKAVSGIGRLKELLRERAHHHDGSKDASFDPPVHGLSREEYCSLVQRAKEYITDGDVFQVVLSQRIRQKARVDGFDLYRNLRMVNPSPYMYFLQMKDIAVIGSSPEMLVRVEDGVVQTRPIAGTRRRGETKEEDQKLEKELLSDSKERAEHLMLVDLGRNDLGRICDFGTVEVTQLMQVERYSHVMHMVSNIRGTLREEVSPIDALFSCFPAGTLTGAPKIRAMEIIAECEPVRRGVYGGAIVYIDFSGNLDSCIAIRTILAKGEELFFQAGAGIVFDSLPDREFDETLEKLAANLRALEMLMQ